MSTHNLCFGAKIRRKKIYPCIPQFYYIKVGFKGVLIARTCFPDVKTGIFHSKYFKTLSISALNIKICNVGRRFTFFFYQKCSLNH